MSQEHMHIREATHADRNVVQALWDEVIRDAFEGEETDKHHNPVEELTFKTRQFDKAMKTKQSRYFLAFVEDRLVATIAYGSPPNWGILKRTKKALIDTTEIGSLYVTPSMQKRGYGRSLLIYLLTHLHHHGVTTVCFDSIIETSKAIWLRMFGEPTYKIPSKKHDFTHMIWVVEVAESLKRLSRRDAPSPHKPSTNPQQTQ